MKNLILHKKEYTNLFKMRKILNLLGKAQKYKQNVPTARRYKEK